MIVCKDCGELITEENHRITEISGVKVSGCVSCQDDIEAECFSCGSTVTSHFFMECTVDSQGNIRSCPYCEEEEED